MIPAGTVFIIIYYSRVVYYIMHNNTTTVQYAYSRSMISILRSYNSSSSMNSYTRDGYYLFYAYLFATIPPPTASAKVCETTYISPIFLHSKGRYIMFARRCAHPRILSLLTVRPLDSSVSSLTKMTILRAHPRKCRSGIRPLVAPSPLRGMVTAAQAFKEAGCPYRVLGVPKESTYAVVKKAFLKAAMSHHPDVVGEEDPDQKRKSIEKFMKVREAFEAVVEIDGGMSALRQDVELENEISSKSKMSDEEFDSWFHNETGHKNSFSFDMDPAVMREVADMTDEMGGGLDRDGGMWTLANMVSRSVKGGKEAASVLRLEAGDVRSDGEQVDGKLRRRRKRRGSKW